MAETQQKRLREESHDSETTEFDDSNSNPKRQKAYNILSLLDEEEEEEQPTEDLSAMFTTLEQELSSPNSCGSAAAFDFDDSPPYAAEEDIQGQKTAAAAPSTSASVGHCTADEDDGGKSVMRHLLEASDDELGIPNTEENGDEIRSAENIPFAFVDDGIWELEDVAANYYTMLQSELFL